MQNFSDIERAVLTGILRDVEHWQAMSFHDGDRLPRASCGAWRLEWESAQAGRVRPNLSAWLGREPSDADRRAASRAYVALEAASLLVRHSRWGGRTTSLSLTEAGTLAAKRLLTMETATDG